MKHVGCPEVQCCEPIARVGCTSSSVGVNAVGAGDRSAYKHVPCCIASCLREEEVRSMEELGLLSQVASDVGEVVRVTT
jgi:hypothetical protein